MNRCIHDNCWKNPIDPDLEVCEDHVSDLERQDKKRWSVKKVQAYIKYVSIPQEKHKNSVAGFVESVTEAMK